MKCISKEKLCLFLLLPFILALLLASCRRLEPTSWDTDWTGPLFKTSIGIRNILGDSLVSVGPDGNLSIFYQRNFNAIPNEILADIPDTALVNFYALPFGSLSLAPGDPLISQVTEIKFGIPTAELQNVWVKSGRVRVVIDNQVQKAVRLTYKIPSARNNGNPLVIDVLLPGAQGGNPGIYRDSIDLAGYRFDLRGIGLNKVNTIYTDVSAQIDPNSQGNVSVSSQDSIIIKVFIEDIIPEYARGYFGQPSIQSAVKDEATSLFDPVVSGYFRLDSAAIRMKVKNYIGADGTIAISNITSINSETGVAIDLGGQVAGRTFNIQRAGDFPLTPTEYSFDVSTNTSAINQFIENMPDVIRSGYSLKVNPLGNMSAGNDFVYFDRALDARLEVEVPLKFELNYLTIADTLETDSVNLPQLSAYNGGKIKLLVSNGFPVEAVLSLYFMNDNGTLEPIFNSFNIGAASLASNGKVNMPWSSVIPADLSADLAKRILKNNKILALARFHTPGKVQLYDDYRLDIQLVAEAGFTISVK
ncbi:MAG: hypothetical protein RLZZ46_180 [Bacteroidota bacterium]|jgi:hypothetical protein